MLRTPYIQNMDYASMNKQVIQNKPKNFDNVESKDYETYMQAGIVEFWGVMNPTNLNEDNTLIRKLADKYGYGCYTTQMLNVYEVIKRGTTFEDRTRQMKNENLSLY